jgi:hypothetical protein
MPKLEKSTASSLLRGKDILRIGKKVKEVTHTLRDPNMRRIVFEDGSALTVSVRKIHELSRVAGAMEYIERYRNASPAEKKAMLEKSRSRQNSLREGFINELTAIQKGVAGVKEKDLAAKVQKVVQKFKKEKTATVYEKEFHGAQEPTAEDLRDKYRYEVLPSEAGVVAGKGAREFGYGKGKPLTYVTIRRGGRLFRIPIFKLSKRAKAGLARKK